MKRKIIVSGVVIGILLIIYFGVKGDKTDHVEKQIVSVQKGKFMVTIETTGELEAKNSIKVLGPKGLRNHRIHAVVIQNIREEGSVVKKGEWIATLDQSELNERLKDAQLKFEQQETQFLQTQLDTTLQMRQARDQLINLAYNVEEAKITYEQSQYEPPATIKQAQINLEKAKRTLAQAKENYKIKHAQNRAKMREVNSNLAKATREYTDIQDLQKSFTITAPEDGMLIYRRGFDNKPIKEGSRISAWDPVVAELPDLSVMLSKSYVNEVDIRKVKLGQYVEIGLDALPELKLSGRVIAVGNVGETRQNSDTKVFQVNVQISGKYDQIRPAMTSNNSIVTKELNGVLSVPLKCLYNELDSITYVYKKHGLKTTKQEVMIGDINSEKAVILAGLDENDQVFMGFEGLEKEPVAMLEEMDGKRMPVTGTTQ